MSFIIYLMKLYWNVATWQLPKYVRFLKYVSIFSSLFLCSSQLLCYVNCNLVFRDVILYSLIDKHQYANILKEPCSFILRVDIYGNSFLRSVDSYLLGHMVSECGRPYVQ